MTGADGKPLHTRMITFSIMAATIMQALDTTIANVALPHMQGSLNATQEQVSWVLTSYIVAAAIMTAPTGILAARLGRKRLFIICIVGFTLSSMLCGAAANLPEMVLFRLLQGVFGAGLVPLSQSTLLDINPPQRHGQAMAIWGIGIMLGPIMGPMLGGWLTENYNWRWVFYINVPIGILAFLGVTAFMPETEKNKGRRFDFWGFLFLSLAIGCLQMMLDRGESKEWFSSWEILIETGVAVVSLYLFIIQILTAKHPFLDLDMFKDSNYAASLLFIFVIGIILLATMALLPPYLQSLMGYPVITTGLALAPRGVGTMVSMMIVGRIIGKVSARVLVCFGMLITAFSLWQMSTFTPQMPMSYIINTGLVQGFGMGFVFIPLSTLAYATLAPKYRNDAAAIFSLVRNIGSSIGISIMITMLARYTQVNHAELGANIVPFGNTAVMLNEAAKAAPAVDATAGFAMLNAEITSQAAAISYLNDFKMMMWVVLGAVPLLLLIKGKNGKLSREEMAHAVE
jgi:DHA2 family multidrug resistance protein